MSEPSPSDRTCPKCGASMAADTTEGLCPACLLAMNLATQTELPEDAGPYGTEKVRPQPKSPPAPRDIAGQFPQFEILECLGRGGMGVVYKARQKSLDRLVALKILAPEREKDPQFAERFVREARTLAQLSHPCIVTVHDFGEVNGMFYLVMEFVDGVNLRQLLRERKLSPEEALAIVPPVCEALQYAHSQGVIHRDIKPENLLLDKQGRIKIADFGIAKILGRSAQGDPLTPSLSPIGGEGGRRPGEGANVTQDHVIGTPQYMAPEQTTTPQKVDHRADIYSLGVVLYEMLTGEPPGKKFEPPSRRVRVDVRIDEIVLRALEKEPERRYQTATQFKTMVETMATPAAKSEVRGPKSEGEQGKRVADTRHYNPWEPTIVFAGTIIFVGMLLVGLESFRPVALPLTVLSIIGLAICTLSWAGIWPFPSPLFPEPNFSSRNLRRRKTPASPPAGGEPRFSRTAIVGACWVPFVFIAFVLAFWGIEAVAVPAGSHSDGPAWWQYLLRFTVLPLGLTAPFGTTILGWVAVSQIRRSAGKLYGLGLAVFDGLFFPLLALSALIIWCCNVIGDLVPSRLMPFIGPVLVGLVALALFYLLNWIIRRVWRALNQGSAEARPVEPVSKISVGRKLAMAGVVLATALCLSMVLWQISAKWATEKQQQTRGALQIELGNKLATLLGDKRLATYSRITFEQVPNWPRRVVVHFANLKSWRDPANQPLPQPRKIQGEVLLNFQPPNEWAASGTGDLQGVGAVWHTATSGFPGWPESSAAINPTPTPSLSSGPSDAARQTTTEPDKADRERELQSIIREVQRYPDLHRIRIVANRDGSFVLNGHQLANDDELMRIVNAFPPRRAYRMMEVVTEEQDPVHSEFWKTIMKTLRASETKFLRPDELNADRELEIAIRGAWGGPGPAKDIMIFNPAFTPDPDGEYISHSGDKGTWTVTNGILVRKVTESRTPGRTGTFTNRVVEASDRRLVLEEHDGSRSEWFREIEFHGLSLWRFNSTTDRGDLGDFFTQRDGVPDVFDLHASARVAYRGADGVVYDRPDLHRYVIERYDVVAGFPRYYGPNRGDPLRLKLPEEGIVQQQTNTQSEMPDQNVAEEKPPTSSVSNEPAMQGTNEIRLVEAGDLSTAGQQTADLDDLTTRLQGANAIQSSTDRDKALAEIARDAARVGDTDLTKRALTEMTHWPLADEAMLEAARELARSGHRAEAIEIVKRMTSFTKRDAALKELAE